MRSQVLYQAAQSSQNHKEPVTAVMQSPSASTMSLAKGDISHASGQVRDACLASCAVLDLKGKMHSRMTITLCWMAEDLSSLAAVCTLMQA